MILRTYLTLSIILLVLGGLLLSSCSGKSVLTKSQSLESYREAGIELSMDLNSVIAEIEGAETPAGVSVEVYEKLKSALVSRLLSNPSNRITLGAPKNAGSKVTDLVLFLEVDGRVHFDWTYAHSGDYNQDGVVNIQDITPLAENFQKTVQGSEEPAIVRWIDGDGNGVIGISDITPIAENFFTEVFSYALEGSDDTETGFSTVATVAFADAIEETGKVKRFTLDVATLDYSFYRVVPLDRDGDVGITSNVVSSTAEPPTISGVSPSPLEGETGQEVTFSANVLGTGPFTYAWDFGGGAVPNTSEDPEPTVVLASQGQYDGNLRVTNVAGSAEFQFSYSVIDLSGIPLIIRVNVPSGYTGENVTFSANVTGNPTPSYSWDFGSGADPSTSTEQAPTVVLLAPGNYEGNLVVTNEKGSDSRSFAYTVDEEPPPPPAPVILSVSPVEGAQLSRVQFSADVESSGTTLTYQWEFGALGYPSSSTEPSPTVLLGGTGTYPVELSVQDENGTDTHQFDFTVTEGDWIKTSVAAGLNSVSLQLVGGRPAVAYQFSEGVGQDVKLFAGYAISPSPDGSGTWTTKKIVNADTTGFYISLSVIDGRPAVAYQRSGQYGDLVYAISATADGLGSWTTSMVEDGSQTGFYPTLLPVDGNPGIAYFDFSTGFIRFARNTQADGLGTWEALTVDSTGGNYPSMAILAGRPACAYQRPINNWLRFSIADSPDGSSWTTKRTVDYGEAEADVGALTSIANIGGIPGISYYDITNGDLMFALASSPTGGGDWSIVRIHSEGYIGGNTSLAVVGGYPMISYSDFNVGGGALWLAVNTETDGTGAWVYARIDRRTGVALGETSLIDIGGRPAVGYVGQTGGSVRFILKNY